MISIARFLLIFLVAVVSPSASIHAQSPARRPNIILIVADDLGFADLGCYGARDIATPNIDRLAKEGVKFRQFYSNGTECSPTRAALLTGRYQQRVGGLECAIGIGGVGRYDDAIRLAEKKQLGLPASETSLARMLKSAGYATAMAGKWHLGYEDEFSPNRHGFDHAFYALGGGMDYFHHVEDPPGYQPVLRLNEKPVTRRDYFTDLVADEAVRWLREHAARERAQPYFLYLPFTAPHSPFQGPDDDSPAPLPANSPLWNQGKAPPKVYAAMIESMDRAIGRVLAELKERRLEESTLVIFVSDNGGTASARPAVLRQIKGTTFEGGIRVPAIARWPGVIPAGENYPHPAVTFDFTAMIAKAAGVTIAATRSLDGIDLLPLVQKRELPTPRMLFWRGRRAERTWRAVRDGMLKYVSRQDGTAVEEWLFDIDRDSGEQTDISAQRVPDVARLKAKLSAWENDVRPSR
jgi:arylsulfatase A